LMPMSVEAVQSAHSDLPLSAFFVASVYFTMKGWRHRHGFSLLMALICLAVTAGVKGSGFAYVGLVAALWPVFFLANRLASKRTVEWLIAHVALMTGLVVVSIGLLGGSWYVHNVVVAGNPIGLVQISILGRVVWPGQTTQAYLSKTAILHN